MRTALILGRRHGGKHFEVVSGPENPVSAQLALFKEFQRTSAHQDLEHVQLWTSDTGITKQRRLSKITAVESAKSQKKK
jgi:hypothetical protein